MKLVLPRTSGCLVAIELVQMPDADLNAQGPKSRSLNGGVMEGDVSGQSLMNLSGRPRATEVQVPRDSLLPVGLTGRGHRHIMMVCP